MPKVGSKYPKSLQNLISVRTRHEEDKEMMSRIKKDADPTPQVTYKFLPWSEKDVGVTEERMIKRCRRNMTSELELSWFFRLNLTLLYLSLLERKSQSECSVSPCAIVPLRWHANYSGFCPRSSVWAVSLTSQPRSSASRPALRKCPHRTLNLHVNRTVGNE